MAVKGDQRVGGGRGWTEEDDGTGTDFSAKTGEGRRSEGGEEVSPRADLCFWSDDVVHLGVSALSVTSQPARENDDKVFLCFSDGLCCALWFFWGHDSCCQPRSRKSSGVTEIAVA